MVVVVVVVAVAAAAAAEVEPCQVHSTQQPADAADARLVLEANVQSPGTVRAAADTKHNKKRTRRRLQRERSR